MPKTKSTEELRKTFLAAHWQWDAVNNAKGWASGEVHKRWDTRNNALDALVRAQKKDGD